MLGSGVACSLGFPGLCNYVTAEQLLCGWQPPHFSTVLSHQTPPIPAIGLSRLMLGTFMNGEP